MGKNIVHIRIDNITELTSSRSLPRHHLQALHGHSISTLNHIPYISCFVSSRFFHSLLYSLVSPFDSEKRLGPFSMLVKQAASFRVWNGKRLILSSTTSIFTSSFTPLASLLFRSEPPTQRVRACTWLLAHRPTFRPLRSYQV